MFPWGKKLSKASMNFDVLDYSMSDKQFKLNNSWKELFYYQADAIFSLLYICFRCETNIVPIVLVMLVITLEELSLLRGIYNLLFLLWHFNSLPSLDIWLEHSDIPMVISIHRLTETYQCSLPYLRSLMIMLRQRNLFDVSYRLQ